MSSRREFFSTAGRLAAIGGAIVNGVEPSCAAGASNPNSGSLDRLQVGVELHRRAEHYLLQRYLNVDYYRIFRKLAYPLPISGISLPGVPVPGDNRYPWATWMMWELEQRVNSLGWSAELASRADCARAAVPDLEALCNWPAYCQYNQPDLSSAHAGRLLWSAYTRWKWPGGALRAKIREACKRHAQQLLPLVHAHFGNITSKRDLVAQESPWRKIANIPVIGTTVAAMTAGVAGLSEAAALNRTVSAIFDAILEFRSQGLTEGVGYDGYTLDFISDWLSTLPDDERDRILDHPNLGHYLDESFMLGAPGALQQVAELSDVEPREMPFHYSAQVKLARWRSTPLRQWFLRQWPAGWIRSDALGLLHGTIESFHGAAPPPGAMNAHYAGVLRTGWGDRDLTAVVSCNRSPMSHVQTDNGMLLVGVSGRWLITDPGYQQYMPGEERDFTLGAAAHNYPLINGHVQDRKRAAMLRLAREGPDRLQAVVDLTRCYPVPVQAKSITRTVWTHGNTLAVVADAIEAKSVQRLAYHWQGHRDAAWYCHAGWVLLHFDDVDLWFTSPQAEISDADITRHAGSRGELTLAAEISPVPAVTWWVFSIDRRPATCRLVSGERAIEIETLTFAL